MRAASRPYGTQPDHTPCHPLGCFPKRSSVGEGSVLGLSLWSLRREGICRRRWGKIGNPEGFSILVAEKRVTDTNYIRIQTIPKWETLNLDPRNYLQPGNPNDFIGDPNDLFSLNHDFMMGGLPIQRQAFIIQGFCSIQVLEQRPFFYFFLCLGMFMYG